MFTRKKCTIRSYDSVCFPARQSVVPFLTWGEVYLYATGLELGDAGIRVFRDRNARQCHSELREALCDSVLEHPPYSPDLSPCYFNLIPQLKKPLRGKQFANREDILTAFRREVVHTDVSHTAHGIQRLHHRWQRRVEA
ncbi:hypothetical protein ANN_02331 [Periplaneta americana]|uniref:Uncharacterized protein n=1 Tax=Periplaneta americana TaxID=6978 RepID=A0ABQ8TW29_PERAM|nr:hypothetical protein ANN_02331 [Periplaneta americana]